MLADPEQAGEEHADLVGSLRGGPDGEVLAGPLGDHPTGLHRDGRVRLLVDRHCDVVRGGFEDRGEVVAHGRAEGTRHVRGVRRVHERLVIARRLVVDHRRQSLVVDVDELGGVFGHVLIARHDEGNRITDEARFVVGHRRSRRVGDVLAHRRVPLLVDPGIEVGRGEDGAHPGQRQGRGRVDAADPRPCERTPDEGRVHHARPDDVVDERATAGQEPGILHALDARTDVPRGRGLRGGHRRVPLERRELERLF